MQLRTPSRSLQRRAISIALPYYCLKGALMAAKQVILVATDLGESADEAVRQAHEWATTVVTVQRTRNFGDRDDLTGS